MPPIFQPEVIARAVAYAIDHPSREMWIGWPTVKAILGQLVIPGLLDHYLASHGYESQVTDALPPTHTDNVDAPLPGDRGAHGKFDDRSRPSSSELWLRMHRGAIAVAALGLLGATMMALRRAG